MLICHLNYLSWCLLLIIYNIVIVLESTAHVHHREPSLRHSALLRPLLHLDLRMLLLLHFVVLCHLMGHPLRLIIHGLRKVLVVQHKLLLRCWLLTWCWSRWLLNDTRCKVINHILRRKSGTESPLYSELCWILVS